MKTLVNLLPTEAMRWQFHRRQIVRWTYTLTVILVVLIATQSVLKYRERYLQQQLAQAELYVAPLKQASQQISEQLQATKQLRQQLALAESLEQSDSPLQLLQIVSGCCQALNGRIQLASYRMDEQNVTTTKGQPPKTRKLLVLRGQGENDAFVSAFVSLLKDSAAFREVTLQSSQAESDHESAQRSFLINCVE